MKTANYRDLRNSFPTADRWIEKGDCVEITKSGKPFARSTPSPPETHTTAESTSAAAALILKADGCRKPEPREATTSSSTR